MSTRLNVSANPGTLTPRKFDKYLVTYSGAAFPYTITYKYYGQGAFLARVEIEYDATGREIRGQLFDTES